MIKPILKLLLKIFTKRKNVEALVEEWTKSTETKVDDKIAKVILDLVYGDLDKVGQGVIDTINEIKGTK